LSAFFDDNLTAATTITELMESESVCHASAAKAMEPVITAAHILRINNAELIIIETIPSMYALFVLSMTKSYNGIV
jgi:hypothetical protein